MKTLINTKTVVEGNKVTITGEIVEHEFHFPMQQVTIGYLNPINIKFPRHVQLSNEALFVKSAVSGFALRLEDFVSIALAVEPRTSFSPFFKRIPTEQTLSVEIASELNPDLQWQESENGKEWNDILGETKPTLDKAQTKMAYVRCVASSDAGRTATPAIKI